MTVGIREVKEKRKHWSDESKKKGAEFLGKHMIPVVLGPKDRHYVIDHHHWRGRCMTKASKMYWLPW